MNNQNYVLSYYDSLIRQEDYNLLDGKKWINDVLIEFCFEYFKREQFKEHENEFCYLGPSLTHLIKMSDVLTGKSILDSMSIEEKRIVLIALNNQTSITKSGGTHWSLLVYYPKIGQIVHYDSSTCEGNHNQAKEFYEKLKAAKYPIQEKLIRGQCIAQNDSYNCGIHLISNANAILLNEFKNDPRPIIEIADQTFIQNMRKHIMNLIDELAKRSN